MFLQVCLHQHKSLHTVCTVPMCCANAVVYLAEGLSGPPGCLPGLVAGVCCAVACVSVHPAPSWGPFQVGPGCCCRTRQCESQVCLSVYRVPKAVAWAQSGMEYCPGGSHPTAHSRPEPAGVRPVGTAVSFGSSVFVSVHRGMLLFLSFLF